MSSVSSPSADTSTDPSGSDGGAELTLDDGAPTAAAGAVVQAVASDLGVSAERATRLRALVEQLVIEAREREAVGGASGVVVRTAHGAGRLRVHVADRRLPLLAAESRHAPSRRMAALGFADHLRLACNGADGNVATCEVDVDDGIAAVPDELAAVLGSPGDAGAASAPDRASDDEAAALVLRPMEPDDAAALARCVYRCYGYSYLDPVLYQHRPLRRALRLGLLRSFVAVAPDGEVVGHCALTFDHAGDPVPEAGKLVVDPRFRGHHVAERLAALRKEWAVRAGLVGYWSECVTNHPFSQREVIATGGTETGLLIGAVPASLTMQGLDNHDGRHTLLPMYVPVADTGSQPLHVPARHAQVLSAMVASSGVAREVVVVDDATPGWGSDARSPIAAPTPTAQRSTIDVDVAVAAGTAHLRVAVVGDELVDRIGDEIDALSTFDLGAVHLDLPLGDPASAAATVALERLGFCWGAWVPCFGRGDRDRAGDGTGGSEVARPTDVLRLQRTGGHPVDVTDIDCARAQGEVVRDHVVAEWHRVRRGR